MSIPSTKWAWEIEVVKGWSAKLLPSTKLVLLSLADHSKACGCCFPSTKRIGSLTSLSQRSVQHHIKILQEMDLVRRVKKGFKLNLPPEIIEPCSATGCTLKAKSIASTISTKVDINNHKIEPTKTHIHVPEWLKVIDLTTDIKLVDNIQNPKVQSWISDIEKDFNDLDLISEAKKYALWWEDKTAKKPKLAFRNWLDKARKNNGSTIKRTAKGSSTEVTNSIDEYTRKVAEHQRKLRENK
jgi:DNA-binding transcriptional ArsR family regulator